MNSDSRQSMNEIFAHVTAGRFEDAEALCRETLLRSPDDINVLGMLGAILLKTGRGDEAETMLERTIELEPGFAKPHEDLGALYLDRGDAPRALQYLKKAIALNANEASAHRVMAIALHRLGRFEEADAARRRFFSLAPGADPLGEAELHRKSGKPARAEQICEGILRREPENIDALLPVPLHWRRQAMRGFNQAAEICESLRGLLDVPIINGVTRIRATPYQSGLGAEARRRNLSGAFRVQRRLSARHVLIVDDVVTTGATCERLASALIRAGVERVSVLALAREAMAV